MNITSKLTTIKAIVEAGYHFNVPIYQRLYVWGPDQVKTLLEDLLAAYNDQRKEIFFLGGALVMQQEDPAGEVCLELIDGQQRFTTLWMLGLMWRDALTPFLHQRDQPSVPRISFSIRPEVNEYFERLMQGEDVRLPSAPKIEDALALMRSFREMHGGVVDFADFTRFISEQVQMVITSVPTGTDLNKLFELINNRGVQLQHHEILKAKMLSCLREDLPGERQRYAFLWDACADMGNYVEKSLATISSLNFTPLFCKTSYKNNTEELRDADAVLQYMRLSQEKKVKRKQEVTLEDLLSGVKIPDHDEQIQPNHDKELTESGRSIISFSMLLQHTLRIWLAQNNLSDIPRILDKDLLDNFQRSFSMQTQGAAGVKSFVKLLWEVRYCFDKYVIKWVMVDNEEIHLIRALTLEKSKKTKQFRRVSHEGSDGFSLLQSMLYHSQEITTHYWLTPLLSYILGNNTVREKYYDYLRHLDNHLLSGVDTNNLCPRTREFLVNPWRKTAFDLSLLQEHLGVTFPHYWFYKLEFVLWYYRDEIQADAVKETKDWSAFRMTAKNSIEHVAPQTPQSVDIYTFPEPEALDMFGNLALVSRSINSEFGNKPFNEKRQQFINRNRDRPDSLKLALIYRHTSWSNELAQRHQRKMITLLQRYVNESNAPDPGE